MHPTRERNNSIIQGRGHAACPSLFARAIRIRAEAIINFPIRIQRTITRGRPSKKRYVQRKACLFPCGGSFTVSGTWLQDFRKLDRLTRYQLLGLFGLRVAQLETFWAIMFRSLPELNSAKWTLRKPLVQGKPPNTPPPPPPSNLTHLEIQVG